MASAAPSFNIIDDDDDDDGFDWEAAVKAIDFACGTSGISNCSSKTLIGNKPPTTTTTTSCRQSTLDRFIKSDNLNSNSISNSRPRSPTPPPVPNLESDLKIDPEAAKTWIYPVNIPLRDYQLAITRTALFSNTLVALPTGLGKTLIAAVVMYNYFRWFPEGKIVFAAPSRPLVMQQIEACHYIVGIPQEWTIDMTGQTSPSTRACFWKAKRVFFVTPQVLEKDIQSGSCLVKHLVCLVIDEAHRASGNYSYCVAVRELMAVPVQMRILALTATPGSKQQKIQEVIDNLQISTLEYRNESDHDVTPYVHDRKIELIEVPMGHDAVEVNNLLLEVIRPFVSRLSAIGVLPKPYFQTLSPCDLLNARDKFRQAPPQDLHHLKYGEVEGYFGVLITLYHIRKLLSSHGIRPAFEMLEEKLKQGSFARFMSRNEILWKAKLQMQQTLSHGDLSPKFSKMLEVLVEHFKTKDSRNSRVIIFSNFRGSVRDIMEALADIGEHVKATEFIGQSSGKTSKGQSQKAQQAVLEKFRAGGFNVIVATSIGEEGLDIMEVDLVICFDANVSPLRMIQRMGRTGRKHEGRVVVLACEGSELKGYMRKQASGKNINKHMRNGGISSFHFHSSPRMVPHVFRPEVQFIKMSIEQFVPRGKKVKDDEPIPTTVLNTKLTDAESDLVAKYFNPSRENKWRPSFIAFPHFQAYPSRVHEVAHSVRTGILIDTMQRLQGLSFSSNSIAFDFEGGETSERHLLAGFEQPGSSPKGNNSPIAQIARGLISARLQLSCDIPEGELIRQEPETNRMHVEISRNTDHNVPDSGAQNPPIHSFLFGSDFVTVDLLGRVMVVAVPVLPLNGLCHSKCSSPSSPLARKCFKEDSVQLRAPLVESEGISMKVKGVPAFETRCCENKNLQISNSHDSDGLQEKAPGTERILQKSGGDNGNESPDVLESKTTELLLADESSTDLKDVDLSPRLTNFIECGVVPESPTDSGILRSKEDGDLMVTDLDTPSKLHSELIPNLSVSVINGKGSKGSNPSEADVAHSCIKDKLRTPVLDLGKSSPGRCILDSKVIEGIQSPLQNLSNSSCSKDWALSSGGKSESVEPKRKLKRLFKRGDINGRPHAIEEKAGPSRIEMRSAGRTNICAYKHGGGDSKQENDVRVFIEEEAEVSLEVTESDDEEYEQENDSYDDSFIDDKIDFTVTSTRAEATATDMMAIYRRSLLSQSPWGGKADSSVELSSGSAIPSSRVHASGSLAGTPNHSPHTPQTDFKSTDGNPPVELNSDRIYSEAVPITGNVLSRESASKIESRKRKLNLIHCGSLPIHNLVQEFLLDSEDACKNASLQDQVNKTEGNSFLFDDDPFYGDIDLDALEEEAVKQLASKSQLTVQNKVTNPETIPKNLNIPGSPTFDLGI